jgi:type VI secretion system secreted protein VgrG
MEVLVAFVNGDPEQPIVTGCVYNGINKPPANYPKDRNTVSTFYTSSSKGGGGYNELRFDDLSESEEIYARAQKDLTVDVMNNVTETIASGSKTVTLESKDGSVKHSVRVVEGDHVIEVETGNCVVTIDKGDQSTILKSGNKTVTLKGGDLAVDVEGNVSVSASGNITLKSKGDIKLEASGGISLKSQGDTSVTATGKCAIDGQQTDLSAKAGFSVSCLTYKLDAKTNVAISGLGIKVEAKTMAELKSAAATTIEASMVQLKAAVIAAQGTLKVG